LSNSAPGAIINGTNKTASGRLSLVYTGVNPSFIITNGGMTLSASTTFKVTKTGAALPLGVYILPIHATRNGLFHGGPINKLASVCICIASTVLCIAH